LSFSHHQIDNNESPLKPSVTSVSAQIDAASVREQLERLLADGLFRKSKRYSDLLRFIVERTLDGKQEDLHERTIGFELFSRAPDYDVSIDPMVRVVASEVRKRLALYYRGSVHNQELLIEIPLGGYTAEFHTPAPILASHPAEGDSIREPNQDESILANQLSAVPSESGKRIPQFVWGALAALVVAIACWGVQHFALQPPTLDLFWEPLMEKSHPLAIYIGSPPADIQTPVVSGNSPETKETTLAGYDLPIPGSADCCTNVSMLDVRVGQAFASFLRKKGTDSLIRPARGAAFADLTTGSALLIGINNEWLLRLEAELPFRFRQDASTGMQWIEDSRTPSNHQWSSKISAVRKGIDWDYALISRIHDSTTGHWWIGVAGFSGDGTARAQEFLTNKKTMNDLSARLPKDWKNKNLQIVLSIRVVQDSPGIAQVVSVYSW
jgi:hypothetical protein